MTRVASGVDPKEKTPWEQVARRQIGSADLLRFEGYVTEIFTAFGLQPDTPGTRRSGPHGVSVDPCIPLRVTAGTTACAGLQ
jgi:hypothetical protein